MSYVEHDVEEPNWFAYELCMKQIDFEQFVLMLRAALSLMNGSKAAPRIESQDVWRMLWLLCLASK